MDQVNGVSYPKTGKRGVPQQFPRRLYNMLESESQLQQSAPSECLISWSQSGKAFRIEDVTLFSTRVLPKYFRTNKFSSFQRNLNLYGFSKVRRGPDADMYAHPSFLRGRPEILSELKKCKSAADRKRQAKPHNQSNPQSPSIGTQEILPATMAAKMNTSTRAVSPTSSSSSDDDMYPSMRNMSIPSRHFFEHQLHQTSQLTNFDKNSQPTLSELIANQIRQGSPSKEISPQPTGKLDLLTLAITCLNDAS